jgi:hypothetical protein
MTSRATNPVSPKFVKAGTALALQKKMVRLIISSGNQYDFYAIQQLIDGSFIAWYRDHLKIDYTKILDARSE